MKIQFSKGEVVFEGEFILDNSEEIKKTLLDNLDSVKSKSVTLDLSQLSEIDSAGIQLLLSFSKSLAKKEIEHKFTGINDEIQHVLEISGLDKYFKG